MAGEVSAFVNITDGIPAIVNAADEVVPPLPNVTYDGVVVPPVAIVTVFVAVDQMLYPPPGIEVLSLATTIYSTLEFAAIDGIVQEVVLVMSFVDAVPGKVDDTYTNPFGIASFITILFAIAAPLFTILILNATRSFKYCGCNPIKDF